MNLHRSPLLLVAAVVLFIVLRADAQLLGYPSFANAHLLMGYATWSAHGATAHIARSGEALSAPERTASRTPVPRSRAPATGGSSSGSCSYAVTARQGDTVSAIARRCGVSASSLASENRLSTSSTLGVGQTLVVPSARPQAPVPTRVPARPTRSYGNP